MPDSSIVCFSAKRLLRAPNFIEDVFVEEVGVTFKVPNHHSPLKIVHKSLSFSLHFFERNGAIPPSNDGDPFLAAFTRGIGDEGWGDHVMAFVAECPFCGTRTRAPDNANGSIGCCPRCTSYFTLAFTGDAGSESEPAVVGVESAGSTNKAEAEIEPTYLSALEKATSKGAAGGFVLSDIGDGEGRPTRATWVDGGSDPGADSPRMKREAVVGAVGLLLGGCALLCASVSFLSGLVVPLSGLGLLAGIGAIVLVQKRSRSEEPGARDFPEALAPGSSFLAPLRGGLVLPISASAASGLILVVALFLPALLGPKYDRSRQRDAVRTNMRAIPLGSAPATPLPLEWVDASRYALQQGDLRVQVANVTLEHPAAATKPKAKPTLEVALGGLLVRLRVTLAETGGRANKSFDWQENREAKPFGTKANSNPVLTGSAGTSYAFRHCKVFDSVGGKRRANLFPVKTADEVFTFETPPAGWESLRLEVPASAWGAAGVFRFTIPASMLVSAPTGGAAPTTKSGT
jgi:hypothetical protein